MPIFDLYLRAVLEEDRSSPFTYKVRFSANRVIDPNDVGWCGVIRAAFPFSASMSLLNGL